LDRLCRRQFLAALASGCVLPWSAYSLSAQELRKNTPYFDRRTREAVARGLAYLARRQNEDGSFGVGGYSRNVAVCGLSGMAFLSAGHMPGRGTYGGHVDRCVTMIVEASQDSGYICIPEAASRGPMYGHGFATLFLSEVYGMTRNRSVRDQLAAAIRLIVDTQNSEGGWRYEPRRMNADISVTVCQIMALRAARNAGIYVPNETIERSVEYVKRCQNPDGGFMYRLTQPDVSLFPRSAAAVVALHSAGIYDSEEVRRGLDYLMKFPPRQKSFGDQNYYFYGHYYAVQVMWQAGGEYWKTWYPAIRDVLVAQQGDDGSWFDTISPEYGTAMAVLILQMPGSYLPIFQR
jgi:prenyltransferase beta subunit